MSEKVRPTKKQKELLDYISAFIGEHGYSPSYREIMRALDYNSVATVALHVNNLIKRGHLQKRDRSARSLEVVNAPHKSPTALAVHPGDEKWLIEKIEQYFIDQEKHAEKVIQEKLDELYVLIGALKVLGFEAAARSFMPRLVELKNRVK